MEKLHGALNLSAIKKELVETAQNGNKRIWVDAIKLREPSKYGDTHRVTMYDREKRESITLGFLRLQSFGGAQTQTGGDMPADIAGDGLGW